MEELRDGETAAADDGVVAGVSVRLENESVWSRFHHLGTEMLLTPAGRRMFPCCRFSLRGLEPGLSYHLLLDIAPLDDFTHRWTGRAWERDSPADTHIRSPACAHPDSPALGQRWMDGPVSFYKVKLTQASLQPDAVSLRPMRLYQPRLLLVPVSTCPERDVPLEAPDVRVFTFPKTQFYTVTSYQNPQVSRLKIDCNPFMLAFREDESSARLIQSRLGLAPARAQRRRSSSPAGGGVSDSSGAREQPSPTVMEKPGPGRTEDEMRPRSGRWKRGVPLIGPSRPATGRVRRVYRRMRGARKARAKWWTKVKHSSLNSRPAGGSGALDRSLQPDLEDVDGLLFVSFTAKEALDIHVGNMKRSVESSHTPDQTEKPAQDGSVRCEHSVVPVTHTHTAPSTAERLREQEQVLLQQLRLRRNRQILHPWLQQVGMKLNLLDPASPVDLQYLGVDLPLPAPDLSASSSSHASLSSHTGKAADPTRFKVWMEKFSTGSRSSAADCPLQASAFSSDLLDQYLESEGPRISERAAVFSTHAPSPVVYQTPVRSYSYVRTLQSVLQTRTHTRAPRAAAVPSSSSRGAAEPPPAASAPARSSGVAKVRSRRGRKRRRPQLSFNREAVDAAPPSGRRHSELLTHEEHAYAQGHTRTALTAHRARFAINALVTAERTVNAAPSVDADVCEKAFCRLGCVCESLNWETRGSMHCGRVQCMLGCGCFRHKILLKRSPDTGQTHSSCSLRAIHPGSEVRPERALRVTRLWRSDADASEDETLHTPSPAGAPRPAPHSRAPTHTHRVPPQAPAVEKDLVYLYLESMMTCARVREYNSDPPPQVHFLPPRRSDAMRDSSLLRIYGGQLASKCSERSDTTGEPEPMKVLEIISSCNWEAHRSLMLKQLYRFVNMDHLSSVFHVYIYKVELLSKQLRKDKNSSTLTFKVRVSLSEETQEETRDPPAPSVEQTEERVEERPEKRFPLLSRVTPAGYMKADVKTPVNPTPIKVNGKTYAQAKLLLGHVGALHPANRLAAYVTGRIKTTPRNASQTRAASQTLPVGASSHSAPSAQPVTQINQSKPVFKAPAIPRAPDGVNPKPGRVLHTVAPPLSGVPLTPPLSDTVVPASALPPGQQVVLQPVAGMTGVNVCQFNGQMIQLVPVSAALPKQTSTGDTGSAKQERPRAAPLPQPRALPFVLPRIHCAPGRTSFSFGGSSSSAPGGQSGLLNKTGAFSFRICPPSAEGLGKPPASAVLLPGGYKLIKLPTPIQPGASLSSAHGRTDKSKEHEQSSVPIKAEPSETPIRAEPHDAQLSLKAEDGGAPIRLGGFCFEFPCVAPAGPALITTHTPPQPASAPGGAPCSARRPAASSLSWLWRGRADLSESDGPVTYSSDGWTTDDSSEPLSEEDVDVETLEEDETFLCRLRARARRKTQRPVKHRRLQSGELWTGAAHRPAWLMSDLPLYTRSWRLNRALRERRRQAELRHSLAQLRRTMAVGGRESAGAGDLLRQARQTISALEDHGRFLMARKRALIRQHSHFQTLISQHSEIDIPQRMDAPPADPPAAGRGVRLPNIVLQAFGRSERSSPDEDRSDLEGL